MNTGALERGGSVARDETQIAAGPSRREWIGSVGPPNRWTVLALVALGTFRPAMAASPLAIARR